MNRSRSTRLVASATHGRRPPGRPSWRPPDIDVVSVAIANELHRPVVEALLAAGKHVLCEKPLAPSVEDAAAMVAAAEAADTQSGVGFSFRRTPGINAIREQLDSNAIGEVRHFNGHYWCDYAQNPSNPMSWRYKGGPGSGALADIGSHMIDLGEYLCGPIAAVSGAVFQTFTTERPVPLGAAVGHAAGAVGDAKEPVENEDIATFTATFAIRRRRHLLDQPHLARPAERARLRGLRG